MPSSIRQELSIQGLAQSAMLNAVQEENGRLPGLVTFLVTAPGPTLFGIAFWGLVLGLAVHQAPRAAGRKL